ncbi:MAG: tetratricopeptide repeat protein, partial [Pasteurellaceae bacterium]|nr:tetratricopeptide repeat protein [Pasteurellaceae bacterium]
MDDIIYRYELSKKDRQALQRFLYQEMIRLSVMIDETLTEPQIYGLMSALVKKAKYAVNGETDEQRIEQLLQFLYQEQGFHCHHEEYFYTENLLLNKVLRKKRGMPVSLGAVLLYLAAVLDLPLFPVNFPTQLVVRTEIVTASGRKETRFINPWDGSALSYEKMEKWLEGEMGYGVELNREFLRIAEQDELLERLETVFKMALTREGKYAEALKLIEYRLIFTPEDPYEIRDRGMVLASMECFQAAYDDLSYFIDQCPDDPSAMMLKLEISSLEKQSKASVF